MNVHRPNGYGVAVWPVVRVVGAVGVEGIRYGEVADLAETRAVPVEVAGTTLAAVGEGVETSRCGWPRLLNGTDGRTTY